MAGATGASVRAMFTVAEVARAVAGGRIRVDPGANGPGTPVLEMAGADITTIGQAATLDEAVTSMVERVGALGPGRLRLGVGDAEAAEAGALLAAELGQLENVAEVVLRRRSVGRRAHRCRHVRTRPAPTRRVTLLRALLFAFGYPVSIVVIARFVPVVREQRLWWLGFHHVAVACIVLGWALDSNWQAVIVNSSWLAASTIPGHVLGGRRRDR